MTWSAGSFPRRSSPRCAIRARITSYNVCYTKLLRAELVVHLERGDSLAGPGDLEVHVTQVILQAQGRNLFLQLLV